VEPDILIPAHHPPLAFAGLKFRYGNSHRQNVMQHATHVAVVVAKKEVALVTPPTGPELIEHLGSDPGSEERIIDVASRGHGCGRMGRIRSG
jgi:hypothetical protein